MGISNKARLQMTESSWIRRMFEDGIALRKQHGAENVFDLSLGNPILEPPLEFRETLLAIASDSAHGNHRYMPNGGFPETRTSIASALSKETGLPFENNHLIMTCGAGGALNVTFKALLDPGDEVIVIAPYFGEYVFYVDNQGGVPRITGSDELFSPDLTELQNAINKRTRAILINSPNNPTGVVYSSEILHKITCIIRQAEIRFGTEIFVVSDEPYRKLIFGDKPYPFPLHHHPRTVVATSHSKDLGLAGERIGYIAISPQYEKSDEFIDAVTFANRTLGFVNAPALMQRIVASLQNVTVKVDEYRRKKDVIYNALTEIGYKCVEPEGAFYMFPESPLKDDVEFVKILQSKLVLTVPGIGFGVPGHFRLSFCVDDRSLERSISGFREAFDEVTNKY